MTDNEREMDEAMRERGMLPPEQRPSIWRRIAEKLGWGIGR